VLFRPPPCAPPQPGPPPPPRPRFPPTCSTYKLSASGCFSMLLIWPMRMSMAVTGEGSPAAAGAAAAGCCAGLSAAAGAAAAAVAASTAATGDKHCQVTLVRLFCKAFTGGRYHHRHHALLHPSCIATHPERATLLYTSSPGGVHISLCCWYATAEDAPRYP
jgi:hypothetical protein